MTVSNRLGRQRPTKRLHDRKNTRWYRRGYTTLPHSVWGDVVMTKPPSGGVAATATFTTLAPTTAAPSAALMTVTCTGTGFVAGTVINYRYSNGPYYALPTTFVSATSVTTSSFQARNAGTYSFTTQNPGELATGPKVMTVT